MDPIPCNFAITDQGRALHSFCAECVRLGTRQRGQSDGRFHCGTPSLFGGESDLESLFAVRHASETINSSHDSTYHAATDLPSVANVAGGATKIGLPSLVDGHENFPNAYTNLSPTSTRQTTSGASAASALPSATTCSISSSTSPTWSGAMGHCSTIGVSSRSGSTTFPPYSGDSRVRSAAAGRVQRSWCMGCSLLFQSTTTYMLAIRPPACTSTCIMHLFADWNCSCNGLFLRSRLETTGRIYSRKSFANDCNIHRQRNVNR